MKKSNVRVGFVGAGAVLGAGVLAGGCYTTLDRKPVGTAEVIPAPASGFSIVRRDGRVLFAGQPENAEELQAFIKNEGIAMVIDIRAREIRQENEPINEREAVEATKASYVRMAMTPENMEVGDVLVFREVLGQTTGPALIHSRTPDAPGALWAAYLALQRGFALDEALERGRAAGLESEASTAAVVMLVETELARRAAETPAPKPGYGGYGSD